MCIRDSHRGIGNPRLVNHPHIVGDPNPNLVERLTRISIDPVSYTHLRAHETVLDLVCRLLLEKKKEGTFVLHLDAAIDAHCIDDHTHNAHHI